MQAHKVIDSLKGADGALKLAVPNVDTDKKAPFIRWMDEVAAEIETAQHFVFENVPIEQDGQGSLDLPGVTKEEQDLFSEGLIPVPFPVCWFEVASAEAGETLCYLIKESDEGFFIAPFRVISSMGGFVQFSGEEWHLKRGIPGIRPPMIDVNDAFGGKALMHSVYAQMGAPANSEALVTGEVGLVTYLLLMLSSKTSEYREVPAPERLNRSRAKKDRAPVPAHRLVSIIPQNIAADIRREHGDRSSGGNVRSSPRMHWRRSHVRTYGDGRKILIARQLIGYKAMDGREMVTHDYRVAL